MQKKLLLYIITAAAASALLSGCSKPESVTESDPPEISFRKPGTYPCKEGEYAISYGIKNPREGVSLEVSSKDKWISRLSADGDSIYFTLSENTADKSRSGSIELNYEGAEPASVAIRQKEYTKDPVINVSEPEAFGYSGGPGTIAYTIDNPKKDIELMASTEAEWITELSVGESEITFTVGANPSREERTGEIRLTYRGAEPVIVRVVQKGDVSVIEADQLLDLDWYGGDVTITYSIDGLRDGFQLNAVSGDAWITGISVTDDEVTFSAGTNLSESGRTGKVRLEYEKAEPVEVSVIQKGCNPVSLDAAGTANCYIVSGPGTYSFPAVKGNSSTSVGAVSSVEVLWETFGTATSPNKGDLIAGALKGDGNTVVFLVKAPVRKGNALIAAKNASGKILWSWHIWITDRPRDQVYVNDAGTMMDRNLGATSATPGDAGAIGLRYQWGRKDPFMGCSDIEYGSDAKSTLEKWGSVASDATTGTVEYAVANPTTRIIGNRENDDWYYTGNISVDETRWQSSKTIYDPCPPGYRVPDGGNDGIWGKALNLPPGSSTVERPKRYSSKNKGFDFGSGILGDEENAFTSDLVCWYPFHNDDEGQYWTCNIKKIYEERFRPVFFFIEWESGRAVGLSVQLYFAEFYTIRPVRCQKE